MPAQRAPSALITEIHGEVGLPIPHCIRREGWFVIDCSIGRATSLASERRW